MTTLRIRLKLGLASLLFTLLLGTVPASTAQQQRGRRVDTVAPAQTPTPTPQPTATPQVVSTPTPVPPASVEELQNRIREITNRQDLAPSMMAVKIVSLDTGRVLYEENAAKLMMPASNMKIYSVAAALDRLGPDFRWTTSAYAAAKPDSKGRVKGDLIIYGRGDPSIAASLNNGDYWKGINEFAQSIAASGVKRIDGDLIGDESYFTGPPLGMGWEWDDLQWYYGAEVSALTINDNGLDLMINPGKRVGAACVVTTGPVTPVVAIVNKMTTSAAGTKRDITVYRPLGDTTIEVSGTIPLDDRGYKSSIAAPKPALVFVNMLRSALVERGVVITGKPRTIDARGRLNIPLDTAALFEVSKLQSPPLSVVAADCLKPSQNLYAELILRTLGKIAGKPTDPKQATVDTGIDVVKQFLFEAGVGNRIVMNDGSGLSRHDLITAEASVQLLTYMASHRYAQIFRDALPIAGVDGTLRTRMRATAAANNVHAKTGTIDMVATLSGYVTTAAGERLVFSILVNNYPDGVEARRSYIDTIAVMLASLTAKS